MLHIDDSVFTYYRRLDKVKRYVDEHLSEHLSVATLARIASLESKYFSKFFREKTGARCSEWLATVRVRRASEMFRTANHTVAKVAFAVGFRDVRTFTRTFKRVTSLTPRDYKNGVRPRPGGTRSSKPRTAPRRWPARSC